jgi:hypothetical protein
MTTDTMNKDIMSTDTMNMDIMSTDTMNIDIMTTDTTTTDIMTTDTMTTDTTTTITTTISNICTSGGNYITQLLYLNLSASGLLWTQYSFNYTAPNVNSATLMFALRNDPSYWYLDDVSVTNSSGDQLIVNGGFETGSLTGWTHCNPSNASFPGTVTSSVSYSGSYSYQDGSMGASDHLSQTFAVVPNNIYSVTFWLGAVSGNTSATFALVTITS